MDATRERDLAAELNNTSSLSKRFTALINTYNYGRFVSDAIESVLAQDFPREQVEIIVVDDGSTDDTRSRVQRFGSQVVYLYQPNGGQASALNYGLQRAGGEFVAVLDADDVWLPQKLRKVADAFDRNADVAMVYHPSLIWDPAAGYCEPDRHTRVLSGWIPNRPADLLAFRGASTSGLAFRREALAELVPIPKELRLYADSYLMYLMIFIAPVCMVDEYLVKYRLHGANRSRAKNQQADKSRARLDSIEAATSAIGAWLEQHWSGSLPPEVAAYRRRMELWREGAGFAVRGCTRREYCKHFLDQRELYAPLLSLREQAYLIAKAAAAMVLGYRGFQTAVSPVRATPSR